MCVYNVYMYICRCYVHTALPAVPAPLSKLRAKLGLKPLDLPGEEGEAEQDGGGLSKPVCIHVLAELMHAYALLRVLCACSGVSSMSTSRGTLLCSSLSVMLLY